jgi:hypothetical protein
MTEDGKKEPHAVEETIAKRRTDRFMRVTSFGCGLIRAGNLDLPSRGSTKDG